MIIIPADNVKRRLEIHIEKIPRVQVTEYRREVP